MTEEFEGDLAGAVFWGADLAGARFRDVDLTGATITHAMVVGVTIDALVDSLVVNGVDVTAYVNERDPWYPLRAMLTPDDGAGLRETWAALEHEWAQTVTRAQALPGDALEQQVDGEWSFVQTLRHVVFAIDKWFTDPVLGQPFHPAGLPNTGSLDFPWPGLDHDQVLSPAEALAVHAARASSVSAYLTTATKADLGRPVEVLENGPRTVLQCLHVVYEEAFWHNRYARRDLALLA